jgi:hypothetical protein
MSVVASAPPSMNLVALALREMGADAVTTQSLMRIAVVLATAVNKASGLKGLEKQKMVLDALREVLATPVIAEKLDDAAKAILADAIDNIIPQTLALVVEAGRSGALKKPTVGCVGSFAALFCRSAARHVVAVGAPAEVASGLAVATALADAVSVAVAVADNEQAAPVAETTEQQAPTSASEEPSQPQDNAEAVQ